MSEKGNSCRHQIQRTGDNVSELLDKIDNLGPATSTLAGLMTAVDKKKLDALGIQYHTTEYWNRQIGYIPKAGELIIYSDYKTTTIDGHLVYIPGMKIGSGNGYVQDLTFVTTGGSDDEGLLLEHIADTIAHCTQAEKDYWNNKLNVTDTQEVVGESLIFNRN
jgi:hypothetical protein